MWRGRRCARVRHDLADPYILPMTAIRKYERLESPGLWRATPQDQRREVIVGLREATIVLAEKMVTVSMLVARMLSRLSMESEPSLSAMSFGIDGPSSMASPMASMANNENSMQRTQVLRCRRCSR